LLKVLPELSLSKDIISNIQTFNSTSIWFYSYFIGLCFKYRLLVLE
jgi:hypothetical protein